MKIPTCVFVACALIMTCAGTARASTVFNVDGTFTDGTTLGGTLTIDTTAGHIDASGVLYAGSLYPHIITQLAFIGYTAVFSESQSQPFPRITLGIEGTSSFTSLVGYVGGPLCSVDSLCDVDTQGNGSASAFFLVNNSTFTLLQTGELTPTPLPAALPMFVGGTGLIGLLLRRRERKKNYLARLKKVITVLGFALLCQTQQASATTILDTIQGLPFDTGAPGGWAFSNTGSGNGQSLGLEFVLASPMAITGVEAYVFSQFANGRANFGIMADAGGVPSGSFISGDVSLVALANFAPLNLNSPGWSLDAGTYWLVGVAISFEQGGWQSNPTFDSVWAVDGATGNGTWFSNSDLPPPMALITGEATPVPAALPLFATGLGALGLFGWRKKKKATAPAV